MTTPARSVIADAAAQALQAWEQSAQRQQELIGKARVALGPVLPGVQLQSLETRVVGDLVVVTDGVVHLGVRLDGTVWLVRGSGDDWTQVAQVRNGRELAQTLPVEVMRGRTSRG